MPKVKNSKHKVIIESLPEGFEIVDGKLVKKAHGGHVTGDQYNYGLTTFNPHAGDSMGPKDTDVRYSLSSVPRDIANLEAEGGETVLTDLNNDGQFGLYDIKGPRHSSGGVPMFLPEQSFIFSDTQKMKMGKEMLKDHGIDSRKKITPAKVSKQYELNKYYGILNDQYADKIQADTADLMLQKNKEGLSKLAFGQEMMKNFEDGVPLAAYPYLQSIGMDPFEFSAKMDSLRQFTGDQQAQPMSQADMEAMNPMAAYGRELPKAQFALETGPRAGTINVSRCGDGEVWDSMQQKCVPSITNDPGQLTANLINADANNLNVNNDPSATFNQVANMGNNILERNTDVSDSEESEESEEKLNLYGRAARGFNNFMSSPFMDKVGETSAFVTGLFDVENEMAKNAKGWQAEQDLLKSTMADNRMSTKKEKSDADTVGVWNTLTGDIYDIMQGNPGVGGGFAGFKAYQNAGEVTYLGGTKDWVDWYMSEANKEGRSERYEAYKILASEANQTPVPEDQFHEDYVRSERQINAIQNLYKDDQDYLQRSDWDSKYEFDPQYENLQAAIAANAAVTKREKNWRYKKAIEDLNEQIKNDPANQNLTPQELDELLYTALTEDEIAQFQRSYQAGKIADLFADDVTGGNLVDFIKTGVSDEDWVSPTGEKFPNISQSEGFFGNTTVGQQEKSKVLPPPPVDDCPNKAEIQAECEEQGLPFVEEDCDCGTAETCENEEQLKAECEAKEGHKWLTESCRCLEPLSEDFEEKAPPVKAPWIQDLIKTQSIADRERDMFFPWQPAVRRENMDVILEDPTRLIAALNSARAATERAFGIFGGPQSMAARTAQAQGQAADAIANAVAGVNQRNVGTVNRANQINAQLDAQSNLLEDQRRVKQYDDTQKVLQTYMDEKNFDREQYADAMSNLITNMSNTYNLNQMYDYFQIDPLSGGDIRQTGSKSFQPVPPASDYAAIDKAAEYAERYTERTGKQPTDAMMNAWMNLGSAGQLDNRLTRMQQEAAPYLSGYHGYGGRKSKRGGESKLKRKWATPFYTGKMGI